MSEQDKRPLDEEFDTQMEVERDPCGAWMAIQSLAARLEKAREVIGSFAEAADGAIDEFDGDDSAIWEHPVAQNIHIKDFRAARAWMEQNDE